MFLASLQIIFLDCFLFLVAKKRGSIIYRVDGRKSLPLTLFLYTKTQKSDILKARSNNRKDSVHDS